ncbi:MAG: hypothetical protein MUF71_11920 [Candidatus Kapabacteria bacterium]|jgi:hypothetical protein|nr:hypothetical protein [Candidatus Kapabacteria bacterium]
MMRTIVIQSRLSRVIPLFLLSLLLSVMFSSCYDAVVFRVNVFPTTPVNLGSINSAFDDMNSAYLPVLGETLPLYFSTNRRTGQDFDVIDKVLDVKMERSNGVLIVQENTTVRFGTGLTGRSNQQDLQAALEHINSPVSDELGPLILGHGQRYYLTNNLGYDGYVVMFSSNREGKQDIYYTNNVETNFGAPQALSAANSFADDAYPTLTQDTSRLYFCSNREEQFDIFHYKLSQASWILTRLQSPPMSGVEKDTVLSSAFDDKCPFILGDILVFTSNRPGGFGGYDLYFSRWQNGRWAAPQNFGDCINTRYDEYRPVVKNFYGFQNAFMIFSSNRPGGKGGFDLYYVGIPPFQAPY